MRPKLLSFLMLVTILYGNSQEPNFVQYSTHNGLSSSETYDVIQDRWGYIWISSDNGLNRFDGRDFQQYTKKDGLTDNTVFKFKKDPFGRIWCTTYNNTLFVIDGSEPSFIPYKHNYKIQEVLKHKILQRFFFDWKHNIYIIPLWSKGYLKIDLKGKLQDKTAECEDDELVISLVHLDRSLNEFILTEKNSSILKTHPILDSVNITNKINTCGQRARNISFGETIIFAINNSIIIKNNTRFKKEISFSTEIINTGSFDQNTFWVSLWQGGVKHYSLDGKELHHFLPEKSVSNVYRDHEGGLWFTTLLNGVFYTEDWEYKNLDPYQGNIPISDLSLDNEGHLWVGYEDGSIYVKEGRKIIDHYTSESMQPACFFFKEESKSLFFNLSHHLRSNKRSDSILIGSLNEFKVYGKSMDSIVFARATGLKYDVWPEVKHQQIQKVENIRAYDFITYNKNLYFASQDGLFISYDDHFQYPDTHSVFRTRVNVLTTFKNYLIIGSRGEGVMLYNKEKLFILNEEVGLTNNSVNCLHLENDSTLWVGTTKGITRAKLTNHSLSIKNITTENGLIDNHITSLCSQNDTLWIGTDMGLTYLIKSALDKKKEITPYFLAINKVEVNDHIQDVNQRLTLSYNQNRIKFHFIAQSFVNGDYFDFRYRLDGLENEWSYTENNSVLYSSLAPGEYEFMVQFKGNNDDWSYETKSISFTIHPPFWKTSWFILIIVFSSGLILFLFLKYKVIIYNGDVLREILRYLLKKIRKERPFILIKDAGVEYKIETDTILFIKSDRNYLEIHTENGKHLIREKIGNFTDLVPDPIEFLRIKRSYIIRIDKVTQKGNKFVKIDQIKLEVGDTYLDALDKIII